MNKHQHARGGLTRRCATARCDGANNRTAHWARIGRLIRHGQIRQDEPLVTCPPHLRRRVRIQILSGEIESAQVRYIRVAIVVCWLTACTDGSVRTGRSQANQFQIDEQAIEGRVLLRGRQNRDSTPGSGIEIVEQVRVVKCTTGYAESVHSLKRDRRVDSDHVNGLLSACQQGSQETYHGARDGLSTSDDHLCLLVTWKASR